MNLHTRTQTVPVLLALASLLAMAASSEADVVLRKQVGAHFPNDSWCPFENEYDFSFVATTTEADLILNAQPEDLGGGQIRIDDVRIVPEAVFTNSFRATDLGNGGEDDCWHPGAPYFVSSGVVGILDLTDRAGWSLVNAEFDEGILILGKDVQSRASARVTVTGLTPGARYFVTGWSSWEVGGNLNVLVDTPRPPAFSLQNGRFKLELRHDGSQLAGGQVLSDRSAIFWFRDVLKTELLINIVDRCQDKGTYYVQAAGTTATQVSVSITDVQSGRKVTYKTKQGERFPSQLDQKTFRCQ